MPKLELYFAKTDGKKHKLTIDSGDNSLSGAEIKDEMENIVASNALTGVSGVDSARFVDTTITDVNLEAQLRKGPMARGAAGPF